MVPLRSLVRPTIMMVSTFSAGCGRVCPASDSRRDSGMNAKRSASPPLRRRCLPMSVAVRAHAQEAAYVVHVQAQNIGDQLRIVSLPCHVSSLGAELLRGADLGPRVGVGAHELTRRRKR